MKIEIEKPAKKYNEEELKNFEKEQLTEILLELQDKLYKTIDFAEKMLQDFASTIEGDEQK